MTRSLWVALLVVAVAVAAESRAQTEDPPPMPVPEALATAQELLDAGDVDNARRFVTRALEQEPSNPEALLLDAKIAVAERDIDRAERRFRQVTDLQPTNYEANLGLGRIYSRAKLPRQAIGYLKRAMDFSVTAEAEERSEILLLLASAYRRDGQKREALDHVSQAITADNDNFEAWAQLIEQQVALKDWQSALVNGDRMLSRVLTKLGRDPGAPETYRELYAAYEVIISTLRQYFQTLYVRNLDGTYSDRLASGNEARAAEQLRNLTDLRILQIEVRDKLEFFDLISLTRRGLEYDPENIDLLLQHGLLQRNTGQFAKAGETFRRILAIQPDHSAALAELDLLGQLAQATSQPVGAPGALPAPQDAVPTTSPVEDVPAILLEPEPQEQPMEDAPTDPAGTPAEPVGTTP